jgi:light-regulated signal transduction histidine kinase (bacteriophytochrome)
VTTANASFAAQFASALFNYLDAHDAATLSQAYDFGRRAINEGVGVLDLALMYQDALASMTKVERDPRHFWYAAEFMIEALAPFEMAYRGYMDANVQLKDVTRQLEQQNQELEAATVAAKAANQELDAFSYSISHDLRAPVRHIAGFSRLLIEEHGSELSTAALSYLTTIEQSAHTMRQMIDGLLNLSRLERHALVRRRVDLNVVVAEVVRELERDLANRQIEWHVDTLPTVDGDAGLIRVAFVNLLSNALKYTRRRTAAVIHVGRTVHDGETVLFVRDNGAGFDPAYTHKLFGAFQRLHPADEFEGTGIGLATVERIVRKHGGRIWAEGAVDVGATFFFTLPSTPVVT